MRVLACVTTLLVCAGCAPTLIPLGAAVPVTDGPSRDTPLEIVTRSGAPVGGWHVSAAAGRASTP